MASLNIMGYCQNLILPSILNRSSVVITSQRYLRSSMYKKLNLPEPPKRPANAYAKFVKIQMPLLQKQHPNSKATDIVKIISSLWKEADESLKVKLQEETENEKIKYLKELSVHKELIKPHKEAILKEEDKELKRKNRRDLKKLGQPKRPASPFAQFVRDNQDARGDRSVAEFMKVLGAKWKTLSNKEKAPYEVVFQEEKKIYEKELAVWKNEVVKNIVTTKEKKKSVTDGKKKAVK